MMVITEYDTLSGLSFIDYIINTIVMDVSTATQKLQLKKIRFHKTHTNGEVWFQFQKKISKKKNCAQQ